MRLLTPLLFAVCACSAEPDWSAVAAPKAELAGDARFEQAAAIKSAMVTGLTEKLGGAMAESGPAGAIGVCKTIAPAAAAKMGAAHGARVGRTSFKLRNPSNVAPTWLSATVDAARTASDSGAPPKADGQALAWRGPDGELGVAFPLGMQSKCLACHGPEDGLAEPTREALAASYPADRATGFHEGDLRGWLWVELP